ncbi:intraflagellar transport protein 43 homolog isoform X2 [Neocloeon triangulifer]|nr:intraflagellar transport protein 43 homolog isoform X2 [Neocloeon triangulifer]XP_059471325.1 intraflagellar transport protein 43 homolog isoform X2 [Neocloeon triangulifer]
MTDQEFTQSVRPPPRRSRQDSSTLLLSNSPNHKPETNRKGPAPQPPKSKRTGVWGDTVFQSSKDITTVTTAKISPEVEKEIPVIPDLDDLQEEEFASQIAKAPSIKFSRVAVNRVAAYKELDTDLFQHAAFAKIEDISLRLLTTVLSPETELKEPDVPWTWDNLFTEVASQISNENIKNTSTE